jgi:hypothetical protein
MRGWIASAASPPTLAQNEAVKKPPKKLIDRKTKRDKLGE